MRCRAGAAGGTGEPGIFAKTIRPFETYLQHLSRVRTPGHRIGHRQRLLGPDLPRRQLRAAAVWLTITLYIARRRFVIVEVNEE
jgi:hypothetical protein